MTEASRLTAMPHLRYELRVGVTGHRELGNSGVVRSAVRRLIWYVARALNYPEAAGLDWAVISSLAKGSDRIVAEEILKIDGATLQAILPLPTEEYRKDFVDDPADIGEFEVLLRVADVTTVVEGAGCSSDGEGRKLAYLTAGEAVVEECELLICIWDPERAGGTGGTGEVVEYALKRGRMVLWIDARHPEEPARWLRKVKPKVEWDELPKRAKELSRGYHQLAKFAADRRPGHDRVAKELAALEAELREKAAEAGLDAKFVEPVLQRYGYSLKRADELALHYQKLYERAMRAVLYLAAIAVSAAAAQRVFLREESWPIWFEAAAMIAVFVAWWWSRREAWLEKWLHDRYLAEGMRIGMFLELLPPKENAAGDPKGDPLPFYPGPRKWLEEAVRGLARGAEDAGERPGIGELRSFLAEAWLEDQAEYHEKRARKTKRQTERREWIGFGLFGTTLLMAVLHLAGVAEGTVWEGWIGFLVLVLPVWAGAVHAGTAQMELHRIEARSERMAELLGLQARQARRAGSVEELRAVAEKAVELMGTENREWWALLSFQEVKLHV